MPDGHLVLVLRAQFTDAGGDAPLDVELEAGAGAISGDRLVAGPQPEQLVRQRHRPPRQRRGHERSRVEVIVPLDAPCDQDSRKGLPGRQLQIRIRLVVAEEDVVLRGALLDEIVLERQRLDHGVGDDDFQALRFVQERVDARTGAVRAEVASHAVPQYAGFADVQRVAMPVVVQVNARLFGQAADLALEITDWHALHCAFRAFLRTSDYTAGCRA